MKHTPQLSVVVPVFNERDGIQHFHGSLVQALVALPLNYEILYCDDGSTDGTTAMLQEIAQHAPQVRLLRLSRNFGKEVATTAGLQHATGDAIVTVDADGQHPVELIASFVERWQAGSQVVIGLRTANQREGLVKRFGSRIFYGLFSRLSGIRLVAGASDFRLIDKYVQQDFIQLTERNRITRGLIDWLGYERTYIPFVARPRMHGTAGYSFPKLFKLAVDSAVSLSISPLYLTAYIGAIVLPLATLLGVGMFGNFLLGDPLQLHASGGAYLMVLILFLIGIVLVSQGIIGLYLSHIHTETQNRPLYILDKQASRRVV